MDVGEGSDQNLGEGSYQNVGEGSDQNKTSSFTGYRRMAENGFAPPPPPPREFCRHILSGRELKAKSFKKCLHSVRWGVSL